MQILYSWLKDFVDIKLNPNELAEKLTLIGHEVETVKRRNGDFVLDIDVTANRGDCLSHLGMAREVLAVTNAKRKTQNAKQQLKTQNCGDKLKITIANVTDCPKYIGRHITAVKVMPSPKWMHERLLAMGVQPINNVVDATNYVLFETGQPLHVFDAKKLNALEINVRRAKNGENIITLDNAKRDLDKNILVIADNRCPIAVAGIMGGLETGVTNETTDIIIEAAVFDPKLIRQGSKKLKLITEASYRFERGVDFDGVERAMERVSELILETGGGKAISQNSKLKTKNYISKLKTLELNVRNVKRVLAVEIVPEKIKTILSLLGFKISPSKSLITDDQLLITVPSWRHDINFEEDLIEEAARIYGYGKIVQKSKIKNQNDKSKFKNKKPELSLYEKKEVVKDILSKLGLQEVYNYSFIGENDIKTFDLDKNKLWELENSVSPELKCMRSSLIPGLLKSVAKNPDFDPVAIFEIGNVFVKGEKEKTMLGVCVAGGKGKMEDIIGKIENESRITNHESRIMDVGNPILKYYKIRKLKVQVMEIDINELADKAKMPVKSYLVPDSHPQYREISKFPPATRDLAIIINKNIDATAVIDTIKNTDTAVLIVELFDEYENPDKFGPNKKSLAFHIFYQDLNKTLLDKEADDLHKKIIQKLQKKYKAKLRR